MATKTATTDRPEGEFVLKGCILSYPHLTEPHSATADGTPRYGVELRLPKSNTEDYGLLNAYIEKLKAAKAKEKIRIFPSDISVKDGDTWEKAKPEHAGFWIISANRATKQGPPALVRRKSEGWLPNETDAEKRKINELFYPGCVVNAKIGIFFTNKGGAAKIPASLEVLQWAGDGERLGGTGGRASLDELPDIDEDEDDGL